MALTTVNKKNTPSSGNGVLTLRNSFFSGNIIQFQRQALKESLMKYEGDEEVQEFAKEIEDKKEEFVSNMDDYVQHFNNKGVNLIAVIMKVFPSKTHASKEPNKPASKSTSFQAMLGNIRASNAPDEDKSDYGTLRLKIHYGTTTTATANTGQPQQQQQQQSTVSVVPHNNNTQDIQAYDQVDIDNPQAHQQEYYEIKQFGTYFFSMYGDKDIQAMKFGDIVTLVNVKAKGTQTSSTPFLNVDDVNLLQAGCTRYMYISLIASGLKNPYIYPSDKVYNPIKDKANKSAKYSDKQMVILVDPMLDVNLAKSKNGAVIATPIYKTDDMCWRVKKDPQAANPEYKHFMKAFLQIEEWKRGSFKEAKENGEIVNAVIEMAAWENALYPFLIGDINAWYEIAPQILKVLPYIVIGKMNYEMTTSMKINDANNAKNGNSHVSFGVSMVVDSVVFDAVSAYQYIGIPVTKQYASEILANIKSGYKNPDFNIVTQHTEIMCLNECAGSFSIMNSNPNIEYRVITNAIIDDDYMENVPLLKPEDGDALLKAYSSSSTGMSMNRANKNQANDNNSPAKKIKLIYTTASLRKYVYAIFTDRIRPKSAADDSSKNVMQEVMNLFWRGSRTPDDDFNASNVFNNNSSKSDIMDMDEANGNGTNLHLLTNGDTHEQQQPSNTGNDNDDNAYLHKWIGSEQDNTATNNDDNTMINEDEDINIGIQSSDDTAAATVSTSSHHSKKSAKYTTASLKNKYDVDANQQQSSSKSKRHKNQQNY